MSTGEPAGLTPVHPGEILAEKYQVERVLGAGGMGVVVAARHVHLGERVAIKFLLPHAIKKAEVVQRFLQEGRAAVRIKSEHVARILDVGTLPDGAPYIVMELLQGADLSALLKAGGPIPIDLAVEYILQACEAIAEAHSLGIIHRDLKPANLFVARRADGSPCVKVLDFGISKVADPSDGGVELTKTDVMMGSPAYMAPEQMVSARDVDVRADVWSLGVILYCLLTGALPFLGAGVIQLYDAIREGAPPLRPARPDIPPALEEAVLKCLRASPNERFANLAELTAAIVDFGPPHARISAERVARTLGVAPAPPSASPPRVAASITPPSAASISAAQRPAPGTDGSWSGTQAGAPSKRKTRSMALTAAALLLAGIAGAGVVFLLFRGNAPPGGGPPAATANTTLAEAPSITMPVPPAATVSPAPSPEAPATAPPPPSASSQPPAPTYAPTASASALKPPRPPVTARPVGTKTKGGDLFSDPH